MRGFIVALIAAALFAASAAHAQTAPYLEPALKLLKKKDYAGALAALNKVGLEKHHELGGGIAYLTGVAALRAGRTEEARGYFAGAVADRQVGDWALYQLMQMEEAEGDLGKVLADAQAFAGSFPYSPLKHDVALVKARALRATGLLSKAGALIREILAEGYAAPEKAWWEYAKTAEAAGTVEDAYHAYQRIYYEYPHTPLAAQAEAEIALMKKERKGFLPPPTPGDRLKRAYAMMNNRMYKDAAAYIHSLDRRLFTPSHAAELMMHLARADERLGMPDDAVAAYREAAKFHDREIRPEALYRIARIYWNRDEGDKTLETIKTITREFPTHEVAAQARYIEARMDESAGHREEAIRKFERAAAAYPSSKVAEDCLWYAAWLRYLSGDLPGAEQAFARLAGKFPNNNGVTPRALYWLARTMREQGKDAAEQKKMLAAQYPFSYYSFLAADGRGIYFRLEDLKVPNDGGLDAVVRRNMEASIGALAPEPALDGGPAWAYKSARVWEELGQFDTAKGLLDIAAAGVPKNQSGYAWLAWQYYRARCYACVLRAADGIKMDALSPADLKLVMLMLFPVANWDAVSPNARATGIDPFIVLSIIRQESQFDPDIVSVADAHGLMQIIPATAGITAGALGMGTVTAEDLHEPEINVKLGAYYLAGVIKDHGGSLPFALANYNAGPRPVERWKQRFPVDDLTVFIERIPYAETREYVKKVLRNYSVYRKIYTDNLGEAKAVAGK